MMCHLLNRVLIHCIVLKRDFMSQIIVKIHCYIVLARGLLKSGENPLRYQIRVKTPE